MHKTKSEKRKKIRNAIPERANQKLDALKIYTSLDHHREDARRDPKRFREKIYKDEVLHFQCMSQSSKRKR